MKYKGTLVFIHIPKTGGSTIQSILGKKYSNSYTTNALDIKNSLENFQNLSIKEQNSFDLIKGHHVLRLIDNLKNKKMILFLRDPLDQLVSTYFYIKRATWNEFHDNVIKMNSIVEFCEFITAKGYDNLQTRHILGFTDHIIDSTEPLFHFENTPNDVKEKTEKSLKVLDSIDYLFLTKQIDEALLILAKDLSWGNKPFYEIKNKTKKRKKVSDFRDEEITFMKNTLRYDIELFNNIKNANKDFVSRKIKLEELQDFKKRNNSQSLLSIIKNNVISKWLNN